MARIRKEFAESMVVSIEDGRLVKEATRPGRIEAINEDNKLRTAKATNEIAELTLDTMEINAKIKILEAETKKKLEKIEGEA